MLSQHYRITTPEYIEFTFELAGIFRRFLALVLDSLTCALILVVCGLLLSFTSLIPILAAMTSALSVALFIIIIFFVKIGYMWALEWFFGGKTLGKHLMHIRVIQKTGLRVGGMQAFLRNVVRPMDSCPWFLNTLSCYFLGAGFALFSSTQQRLGDFLANTLVIYERPVRPPSPIQLTTEEERFWSNSQFEANLHSLTPQERNLLLQSSLQREELSIEARLRVFRALSAHLQHEFNFQKPAHISDEKLVLSAVSKLFAATTPASKNKHA